VDLRIQTRILDLLVSYGIKGETDVAQIPYQAQKTQSFLGRTPHRTLRRATPESRGVASGHVRAFLQALERDTHSNLHTVLVLRHGMVIAEAAAPGYHVNTWALTHSMAKTITALAIGMLVDDGALTLDAKLVDLFREERPMMMSGRMKAITVRHLLTMSSGVTVFNEAASVAETTWVRSYLESSPTFDPGSRFHYNSMNSYILSAIVRKVTGQGLSELLTGRLWQPLDVRHAVWEYSPEGIEKGGWGLYLPPEDMAKLGQLLLNRGRWQGKPLVSEGWLQEMLSPAFVTDEAYGDYNYGYHIWLARDGSSYLFNGMLGQDIWVCPQNQIVVVVTAGNSELFQHSSTLRIIADYFGSNYHPKHYALAKNTLASQALRVAQKEFYRTRLWAKPLPKVGFWAGSVRRTLRLPIRPLPPQCREIEGTYLLAKNNTGMLPLFIRFMQNNHTAGLSRIVFSIEGEKMMISFLEGQADYTFEIGFYEHCLTELDFAGEKYLVAALGQFALNEDHEPVLKLSIQFPELPNTRQLKFFYTKRGMRIQCSELPGNHMVNSLLSTITDSGQKKSFLFNYFKTKLQSDTMQSRILQMISPQLFAERVELPALPEAPAIPEPHPKQVLPPPLRSDEKQGKKIAGS